MACYHKKFNSIVFNVTQAQTGSPVYVYEYYDGSSMVALTPEQVPDYSTTGETLLGFIVPPDWQLGTTVAVNDNVATDTSDKHCLVGKATTAPTQAVIADSVHLLRWGKIARGLADGKFIGFEPQQPIALERNESMLCWMSVTNPLNSCNVYYR